MKLTCQPESPRKNGSRRGHEAEKPLELAGNPPPHVAGYARRPVATPTRRAFFLACVIATFCAVTLRAQVPQFISYQGRITSSGTNFSATGSFKFALVDATAAANLWANDGTASGEPATAVAVGVTNGIFSVLLGDTTLSGMTAAITSAAFSGSDVRLRIWFNDGSSGSTLLSPDQRLGSVGFAFVAATAATATSATSATSATTATTATTANTVADGAITAAKLAANSVGTAAINDASITTAKLADQSVTAAKLGDASVTASKISAASVSTAALADTSVSTAKLADQSVTTAKIAAGAIGASQLANAAVGAAQLDLANLSTTLWKVGGNSGTIPSAHFLGTSDNQALEVRVNSVRALRIEPNLSAAPNFIGGAAVNTINSGAVAATISGGGAGSLAGSVISNLVQSSFGTIGGGGANGIQTNSPGSTIAGGYLNVISNNAPYATIGGGYANGVSTNSATVAGGYYNLASGFESTVAGGQANTASGTVSFIGGGVTNLASGLESAIVGGELNYASGSVAFIGGGYFNGATDYGATVSGGYANLASATNATVAGGSLNAASGLIATVGGGYYNGAFGYAATVPGGYGNVASGSNSFAAGFLAAATNQGAFVWSDYSSTNVFYSSANNQFSVRAAGGTRIYSNPTATAGVSLAAGAGAWGVLSDRNMKANFKEVDTRGVLEKVAAMPVTEWNYTTQDETIRHVGPMAQDFRAAFGLGEDERHITSSDADGIALAAIQGLYKIVQEKNSRIADLERRLAEIEARLGKAAK